MSWVTPKTDWNGTTEDGVYIGDYFSAVDFNRIKNNLEYLRDETIQYFPSYDINSLGADRTYNDFFYADEINQLEENLETINANTFRLDIGMTREYYAYGPVMDFTELNRLENATLRLYNKLQQMITSTDRYRRFIWNFGIGAEL